MQTIEAMAGSAPAPAPKFFDPGFARFLVIVNGAVPAALLGWDALQGTLGVNGVNFAIRTTGLLGLLFLVGSLAITPLRRLTGWSALIAPRRALGLYAFFYLATHLTIFFLLDRDASLSSTLEEILTRRYLQIGTAGLLLMVPLAVTSTDAMISRLGATRWKRLHRLAYLSAIAGCVHYILLVKADLRLPLAIAGTLAVFLAVRLVGFGLDRQRKLKSQAHAAQRLAMMAPQAPSSAPSKPRFWAGKLRVASVFHETPDVKTLRLMALDGQALPFTHQPGQYLNLTLTIGGKQVRRSYTIASSPTRGAYCEVTIKRKPDGYASCHVHDALEPGSTIDVAAPAGRFVFTGAQAPAVLLLAGGVGITPLMAMVRYLTDTSWGGAITFVVSARREKDLIFREELDFLARRFKNLRVVYTLSDAESPAWTGARGRITAELLQSLVKDLTSLPIYLCGPDPMMEGVRTLLLGLKVPQASILTEAFVSPVGEATPGPEPQELAPPAEAPGHNMTVRLFALSLKKRGASVELTGDQTVLEAAEGAGQDLPFECRSGVCGQCKVKLLRGKVTMPVQDALSAADRASGIILACQARPTEDLELDA